uniref:Uncharacterized protein n=1 Tax=Nothobranchius furzeri TaxID=105023 RepID=A0A8C6PK39_NOTFU
LCTQLEPTMGTVTCSWTRSTFITMKRQVVNMCHIWTIWPWCRQQLGKRPLYRRCRAAGRGSGCGKEGGRKL